MLIESSRALGLLPQLSKFLRPRPVGISKFFSTALTEKVEESTEIVTETSVTSGFDKFRFLYPEFLPDPDLKKRNAVREKLERREMLRRRNNILIPEFYVGSILAVTSSNKHAVTKKTRFVGICIMKHSAGLDSIFQLRNVIDNEGVEVLYSLYSPLILKIEVLRLEKRLDETLFYLRDAPKEYSTFSFDMLQEYHDASKPVPVNTLKVPLNPRPWLERYERMDLKGAILPKISEALKIKAEKARKPWEKYDIMDEYRKLTPEEDQKEIFEEIQDELKKLETAQKITRKRKEFIKPHKQKLF